MIRKIIIGIFALMLTVSIGWLAMIAWQEDVSSADNREAVRLADTSPEGKQVTQIKKYADPEIRKLMAMDIESLREINRDIIGWIRIPDTDINYPLLRGEDNEYYLKHSWKGRLSAAGAIFMEHENSADLNDFNTIIYGHNMRSGSMFGSLKEYKSSAYREAHPYIYILHDGEVFRYDIFAAHIVQVDAITYAMQIKTSQLRTNFIDFALENSEIDTGILPTEEDNILTLSTCTGDYSTRWVVQGVLNEEQSHFVEEALNNRN